MAREIDHRVMNSLQFVASMLAMQSRSADLTDAASQLKIAANRVNIVARIHRHYMANDSNEPVVCLEYLRRLCDDLAGLMGRHIDVTGDNGTVPAHTIQSIGLIVNELATNAAKYSEGPIAVSCVADGTNRVLIVSDKGVGFASDFDPATVKTGLGMKVVRLLAQQLRGTLTCATGENGAGATCKVTFPSDQKSHH